MLRKQTVALIAVAVACVFLSSCAHRDCRAEKVLPNRSVISMDGIWDIAEGAMETVPAAFAHKVHVPGLVSLAEPPFLEPGPKVKDRRELAQKDPRRDAFWYRRTFVLEGALPAVARLKVAKAMFGTRVYLNGTLLGDHAPCFTPGYFDARPALRTGVNELIIRVGADREAVTRAVPSGFDFEKDRYIPGIFDSVELILSGNPHFLAVQTVPDITNRVVRVVAELRNDGAPVSATLNFTVREAKTGRVAGVATRHLASLAKGANAKASVSIPLKNCRLWSPEDPFLYVLEVDSGSDSFTTRFGMRDFRFDPETDRAMLNGKPYYLRGSNITLYRFFEDPDCRNLPWDEKWVRKLHRRIKDMHWNSLRYCIGFPPEKWYDIADEEGILLQDEFPIWFGGSGWNKWPAELTTPQLVTEYTEWMRERWNHPSVVIWDANNETTSDQTGPAVKAVRGLDRSNRPWDNSYMPPAEPGDVFESHPYHFNNPTFKLSQLEFADRVPRGGPTPNHSNNPVVINEYGWLWLNRDGTPTTLTSNLYVNLLGTNSTAGERFHLYARYTAAETEFWRCHRKAAGVLHFTALGYSRPDGQTSDHWLDVSKLTWEPEFYRYVKDSFAPVGLMVDFWKERMIGGVEQEIGVIIINDLPEPWSGPATLQFKQGNRTLQEHRTICNVSPCGQSRITARFHIPADPGAYQIIAELKGADGERTRSLRDLEVVDPSAFGLAYLKSAKASSVKEGYPPELAVDGNAATYWSSEFLDPASFQVDLGQEQTVGRIELLWENAFAKAFTIEVSSDRNTWQRVYETQDGKGGTTIAIFEPVAARYVRMAGTRRGTRWGYAIREFAVFPGSAAPAKSKTP